MKIGIKIKLAVILSVLLAVAIFSVGAVMTAHEKRSLEAQLRSMAETLTDEFASDGKMPLLQRDNLALNGLVRSIVRYPGIVDAYILDDGLIIEGHNHLEEVGTPYPERDKLLNVKITSAKSVGEDSAKITFAAPIVFKQTRVGYAVLTFSRDFIRERVRRAVVRVLLIAVLAVAAVTLLSIPVAGGILRPVFRLFKGTAEIASGNLDYRIPQAGRDEIGELVRSFNHMASELKKKEVLKGAFNRYVNEHLADEILKAPEGIRLGGDRREITVFFADIRDFTGHTNRMRPEQTVEALNAYFTVITGIIMRFDGTVDKFIGDAVMGVFGSPVWRADHLERGVKAALAVKDAIEKVNRMRSERGEAVFQIGIGLDSGTAIVGNMGSYSRMEYTAVGDVVNRASRLAGAAQGGETVVTGDIYAKISQDVSGTRTEEAHMKGMETTVELYSINGVAGAWKSEVDEKVKDAITEFIG